MDLMKIGTQLIMNKLGTDTDGDGNPDGILGALTGLLGDSNGNLDLGSLVSNMNQGGLMEMASSWLGDGNNESISGSQIRDIFGGDKLSEFASQLNIGEDDAADTLADAIPQMVDQGSSAGSLLDSVGGIEGALSMAKKLFS